MAANQSSARIHNKKEIIETLMREGDMSRAGLAKYLKLSKPATAENVEGLIGAGLVEEIGIGSSTPGGGRKPRILRFNRRYRGIAVVDLGYTHPRLAIGDMAGEILAQTTLSVPPKAPPLQKAKSLEDEIKTLLQEVQIPLGMIVLSSPGIFTTDSQLVRAHPQHGWSDIGLDKSLAEAFQIPVVIKNDMSVAVLGEWMLGNGIGCKNMIYISCGVGLGAGLVIEEKLYEGKSNAAGEISYFMDLESYKAGKTLEQMVTIDGLLEQIIHDVKAKEASHLVQTIYDKHGHLEFRDVVSLVLQGDTYLIKKIHEIGVKLGILLSQMGALLDVERIVFGGEYQEFYDILAEPIQLILNRNTPFPPQLVQSALGGKVGLLGGLIFGRNSLFMEMKL